MNEVKIDNLNLSTWTLEWLSGKESACNAGDVGLIPDFGKFSGGENGNLLQYSCHKNPMHRGAWRATVCRVTESGT